MHTFELKSLAFQNEQVCHSHPEAVTLMRYVGVHQSYGVQDRGLGWCTYRGARRSWLAIPLRWRGPGLARPRLAPSTFVYHCQQTTPTIIRNLFLDPLFLCPYECDKMMMTKA
jgi:hypothetical protein